MGARSNAMPIARICRGSALALSVLTLLELNSCIIAGDKCGPHQVELGDYHTLCACEPGWVVSADNRGCTKCGTNQEALNGVCVCKDGYVKGSDGSCESSDIGEACVDDSTCRDPYPHCVMVTEDSEGYCTLADCTSNADCPSSWSCERTADNSHYCRKPPSGIGASCKTEADCSSFDATYCEGFMTHSCMLAGCASNLSLCPSEWSCCDYSALLGSALSICMPADQLEAGACPRGGNRVTP